MKIKTEKILTPSIEDNAVTTEKIKNGAITTEKLDNNAITNEKLADAKEISNWNNAINNGLYQSHNAENSPIIYDYNSTDYPFNPTNQYTGKFIGSVSKTNNEIIQTIYPIELERVNRCLVRVYTDETWSDWTEIADNGSDRYTLIQKHNFTATDVFEYDMPWHIDHKNMISIWSNNTIIYPFNYTVNGKTITFLNGVVQEFDDILVEYKKTFLNFLPLDPDYQTFIATSSLSYELNFIPIDNKSIIVTSNGIGINPENYTVDHNVINFEIGSISETDEIVVYNILGCKTVENNFGRITDYTFTATSSLTYALPYKPFDKSSLIVFINSYIIDPSNYSLDELDVTFEDIVINNGDEVFIKIIDPVITYNDLSDLVVYLFGDQEITGIKTFNNKISLNGYEETFQTDSIDATHNVSFSKNIHHLELTGDTTIDFIDLPTSKSGSVVLVIDHGNDDPNGFSITWPSNIRWAEGVAPDQSLLMNQIDIFTILYSDSIFYGFLAGNDFKEVV